MRFEDGWSVSSVPSYVLDAVRKTEKTDKLVTRIRPALKM